MRIYLIVIGSAMLLLPITSIIIGRKLVIPIEWIVVSFFITLVISIVRKRKQSEDDLYLGELRKENKELKRSIQEYEWKGE
jgi:hypothetical protein